MGYDRTAAVDYARRHWDRPCDDGVFWLNNAAANVETERKTLSAPASKGWEPRFVPDGNGKEDAVFIKPNPSGQTVPGLTGTWDVLLIHGWSQLADCAHFLAKCIQAGGVNESSLVVGDLVNKLRNRGDAKTLAEIVSQERAQRIIDSGVLKPGDVIGYYNISPGGDYDGKQDYTHSTMFIGRDGSGKGRITCHTKSRFGDKYNNDEWFLLPNTYKYTLIHFAHDDAAPGATGDFLKGWWVVEYGSRKEYYYFEKTGTVRYTLTPPRTNTPMTSSEGSGHWFVDGSQVTITWRKTGTVDQWQLLTHQGVLWIKVNDVQGTARRVF